MRYAAEFRRAWQGASGQAIDAGKKLLGYLANQKRLSGVDSLVKRITLEDGTVVEARWDMNIPTVRIYPGGSEDAACELYVESGLLDLGPNIASDANERFNRGLPEFDDSPATLYFGDDVTCADGVEGLNGSVRIAQRQITSQCLPSAGPSVTSRLTSPAKKQAQAVLPASCWSGLMQRYVQAVYGGDALDYSATASALTIGSNTIAVADSIGLIRLGAGLAFIVIDGESLALRAVTPSNACFEAVMQAWQGLPESTEPERLTKTRLLTIGLSGSVIGDVLATGTISASGNRHFPHRAAWVFNHDEPKAVAVFESDGVARCYEATFSLEGSTVSASVSTLDSGDVLNNDAWPLFAASGSPFDSPAGERSGMVNGDAPHLLAGDAYDFPVYVYYDGTTPRIVRLSAIVSDAAIVDQSECFEPLDLYGAALITSDDTRRCRTDIASAYSVAYGYYGHDWSAVRLETCFPDQDDETRVLMQRSAGLQVFKSDLVWSSASSAFTHSSGTLTPADVYDKVADLALAGTAESGCALYNTSDLPASSEVDSLPPNPSPDCSERYDYSYGLLFDLGALSSYETPYFPAYGALFDGMATGCSPQVLTLAWGATSCVVADAYVFKGGAGTYLSCSGAAKINRAGYPDSGLLQASYGSVSGTIRRDVFTYDTPGDCGSSYTLTSAFDPLSVTFTKTQSAPVGDVVASLSDMLTVTVDGTALLGSYLTEIASSVPGQLEAAAVYPDPRIRGVESFRSEASTGGSFAVTREVDLPMPEGSPQYHPGGTGEYIADDEAGDECPTFPMLGMQEFVDDHLEAVLASDDSEQGFVLQSLTDPSWLVEGFTYQAARSLLDASIHPTLQLARGASIGMDRQSITHGYPTVQTPSFVGWA